MEKEDFITCASNGFNHAYDFLIKYSWHATNILNTQQ
jgi:hypothetical protein